MSAARPAAVEVDRPLARLSTVRTGGAAQFFARAGSEAELAELLAWARDAGAPISVVGSGSNLLIADEGVAGLVLKLDGELARVELRGRRLVCGGAARLPAVAARAARAGLSGIEFGVNIPGTVGGAVQMNANAYGGELGRVLEWVHVVTAAGTQRRAPGELGLAYRSSNLKPGEVVTRASFLLAPADPAAVAATLAHMRERRHAAQPQGIKTFGSAFKNPDDPRAPRRAVRSRARARAARGARPPRSLRLALRIQALPLARVLRAIWRRRRLRIALALVALLSGLLTGGWLWLRHSSLAWVQRVQITGVHGPDARAIDAALSTAARRMSTLDVHVGALRAAVAQFAVVREVRASGSFPHSLRIRVIEQPPVAALVAGASRSAVAADGVVLGPALLSGSLPTVAAVRVPA